MLSRLFWAKQCCHFGFLGQDPFLLMKAQLLLLNVAWPPMLGWSGPHFFWPHILMGELRLLTSLYQLYPRRFCGYPGGSPQESQVISIMVVLYPKSIVRSPCLFWNVPHFFPRRLAGALLVGTFQGPYQGVHRLVSIEGTENQFPARRPHRALLVIGSFGPGNSHSKFWKFGWKCDDGHKWI